MAHEPTSTLRARRLRERRAKGIVMVAPVEVGEGGIGLLKRHQAGEVLETAFIAIGAQLNILRISK